MTIALSSHRILRSPWVTTSLGGLPAPHEMLSLSPWAKRRDGRRTASEKTNMTIGSMPQKGRVKMPGGMDRKPKRTIIAISEDQPQFDFDEAELSLPFTYPEYQRALLSSRFMADLTDL